MSEARSARRGRGGGGGAAARRAARTSGVSEQLPYIRRKIATFDILHDEAMEIIESNADTVLEEVGIEFRDDAEALDMLKAAGADVQGERVHFPKGLCRELMKTAPAEFTQHARNPERNVVIGGNNTVFAPVYGPPFVRDLDGERRYATMEDFRNFVKMAYMAPAMHHSGGTVCEPTDVAVNKRHLDMIYSHIKYSNKAFMGSVTTGENAADSVAMAEMVMGKAIYENPAMVSLINVSSPRRYDDRMLGALKVYAKANQATIISPFLFSGAMSPVGLAGTLTQMNAESLAGIAFKQMIKPGCPVIFGCFQTNTIGRSGHKNRFGHRYPFP